MTTLSDCRDDSHLTRWSLLERLRAQSDDDDWRTFEAAYSKLILKCAQDHHLSPTEAEEVRSDVVQRAWQAIPDSRRFRIHRRPGSFRRWLMTVTHNCIVDLERRRNRDNHRHTPLETSDEGQDDATATSTELNDLSLRAFEEDWNRRWAREILTAAIDVLKREVNGLRFQIFSLNVLEEQPAETVARCLGVTQARVHLTVFRLKRKLREIRRRLEGD
jgi:RNA polymerase sigma factor (sigma-70 family)